MYQRNLKQITALIMVIAVMFSLAACSGTLQQQWNSKTSDEKARIIIGGIQDETNSLFNTGKKFAEMNPSINEKWKSQIVPAFDTLNKAISSAINLTLTKGATPAQIYELLQPALDSVKSLLISVGAVKPEVK